VIVQGIQPLGAPVPWREPQWEPEATEENFLAPLTEVVESAGGCTRVTPDIGCSAAAGGGIAMAWVACRPCAISRTPAGRRAGT